MQQIAINTSQNVIIEYELAGVKDRILAFILDALIMWSSAFIFTWISQGLHSEYMIYFTIIPIILFYTLLFEIFNNGQTPGKRALNLKVSKVNGQEAFIGDYITRWAFRLIDIYFSLGSLAILLIGSTDKSQRLGDILANTTVVKLQTNLTLKVKDILSINSLDNYQPKYTEVRQLSESDMILIKTIIDRMKRYPNEAHEEALTMAVEKLKERLHLSETPADKIMFLKTLLKDYIVLTR